jgi:hypothetical protein
MYNKTCHSHFTVPNGTETKLKTVPYGKLEKNIPIIFVSLCQQITTVGRKKMFRAVGKLVTMLRIFVL